MMNWIDDIKVTLAAGGGIGTWLIQMDMVLKFFISLVSLLYVSKKCVDLYKGKK
tara:strand:+ start:56 stop:217 length:162 start_codon:yes stop_codon:yes gene_type:complete